VADAFKGPEALRWRSMVERPGLRAYAAYYNEVRTHSSFGDIAPVARTVQRVGQITAVTTPTTASSIYSDLIFRQRRGGKMQ
jgi:hypothetical protein